ncbi:MAG TPA: putative cytokinetic ring protein SteA [Segeticoccus sp.]|uniref:putative cytokinetic ring protein SteA n=1 Tax=Segeticoccus sp. TaxID=2706531 RepID=UPI002D7EE71A|nr:putative cytokinetic ring protein SteA [Segeticoccus sp.]HET8601272.1 putative cytokinetic ring protein SteA [Segeticoccus sp.]
MSEAAVRPRSRRAVLEAAPPAPVVGAVRAGARTKHLVRRLCPGDLAVIDHPDLDQVSAADLVAARVAGVVNLAASLTGRYPATGAECLLAAHIPLLDAAEWEDGPVPDGTLARLDGDCLLVGGRVAAVGVARTTEDVRDAMARAAARLGEELDGFARNTLDFLTAERDLLVEPLDLPSLRTSLRGRPAVVVVRGPGHRDDLAALSGFLADQHPVLIGVDGGADAVLDAGHRPDLVVGDLDSVSDAALASGAEVVVHAYRSGEAPGLARARAAGVPEPLLFPVTGTSEDAALLLAHAAGASLIVAVGSRTALTEFLDKGRAGMASSFLTRLRVGDRLVDARGLSRLVPPMAPPGDRWSAPR